MPQDWVERDRPAEWLRALLEIPGGYERLLAVAGDGVAAAYRIARARRRASALPCEVPTLREVDAALREIAAGVRGALSLPPSRASLGDACAERGLLVIACV
jgi:hypothetical protein